jgi:membrane protein DedA with SNARE-associated domain
MLARIILHYGYMFIFAGVVIEGDATLVTAAFLARRGEFSLWSVILTALIATTLANQLVYLVAHREGRALADRLAAREPRFARVESWVRQRGGWLLFLSRFVVGSRTAIPVACAVSGMEARRFFLLNLAGAITWTAVFSYVGYSGTRELRRLVREVRLHELPVAAFIVLALIGYLLWRGREKKPRSNGVPLELRPPASPSARDQSQNG